MYDALGRLNSIQDTLGNAVEFSYNASGLLTQVDTNWSITTYSYDANGLLSGANDPGSTRLIYTAAAVPEPGSIIGLGSVLCLLVSMRRRLRRRSTQITVT
jgi:YD repeat-containing protein